VHSDETGWRVGKEFWWLWGLSNKKLSLIHIDPSRGLKTLQKILGETFNGTLIADFLAVYNKYDAKAIQRCLVHLLREIKRMSEAWKDDPFTLRYLEALKSWVQKAALLAKQYKLGLINKKKLRQAKEKLLQQLTDFEWTTGQKKPLLRIQKRLRRHKNELLTFLDHPEVDWHNNHAEQMIRPNVLLRKITFGNDSPIGAINHSIFMSIIQTARLNERSPPEALRELLMHRKSKRNKLPLLGVQLKNASLRN
jgi:transposase-like protein